MISVIMPAFNAGAYITESIASVIAQTYPYWELIIIDDGSTDDTAAIVKQLIGNDTRIKYLYQQNGKQGKARNLGLQNSTGEYIAFLDADDKWMPDKLAIQLNILSADKNIDLLFTQGYKLTDLHVEIFDVNVKDTWDFNDLPAFIHQNQIPILSVIVRRRALLKANCFAEDADIQNAEDYYLWLTLLGNNCKFKSINNRLFYYRIHQQQSTYQNNHLNLPIVNMLSLFYNSSENGIRFYKNIIERIKWFLFDDNLKEKVFTLIKAISKKENKIIYLILRLISPFPSKKFSLAFKLAPSI